MKCIASAIYLKVHIIKMRQSWLLCRAVNMKYLWLMFACVVGGMAWTNLRSMDARGLGMEPGPLVKATKGEVWPKPQTQTYFQQNFTLDWRNFTFEIVGESCDIIQEAVKRYKRVIRQNKRQIKRALKDLPLQSNSQLLPLDINGSLSSLRINLTEPCERLPYLYMNEEYNLQIGGLNVADAELRSSSVWGILRGLESFFHLIETSDDGLQMMLRATSIQDFPRFPHRGLHVDSGRHFIPLKTIFTIIEGMSINKFNVFHWHLVDDQSFPYESITFPELTLKGAYSQLHVYTQSDIAQVIEFARLRGIRVIPEFDTPGHTRSWGIAYPELLTACYDSNGRPDGSLGPMDPLENSTYIFMNQLLREVAGVFPDRSIHLGGDEVPFDCWLSNPKIAQFLEENNMTPTELEEIYIKKIIDTTTSLNSTSIVWQEVFDNDVRIPQDTIVHVWKDWIDYMEEMAKVTLAGYPALLSSCWYLDHLSTGGDWKKFYDCDPTFFPGSDEAYKLVLGGEVCMWSEVVDATNILTRIWPRASAAAERLWSSVSVNDGETAARRLEEHSCRMNLRGIPAQPPNGPGFCPFQLYN